MLVGILFSGNSTLYKHRNTDFPGGPVVKNLPANVKGHRFYPWPGRTPHAMEQLSPFAATTEAKAPRVPGKQGNPLQWEASALHLESSPYKLQLEKAWVYQWRPSTAPNKQINKNQEKKKKKQTCSHCQRRRKLGLLAQVWSSLLPLSAAGWEHLRP